MNLCVPSIYLNIYYHRVVHLLLEMDLLYTISIVFLLEILIYQADHVSSCELSEHH